MARIRKRVPPAASRSTEKLAVTLLLRLFVAANSKMKRDR